MKTHPSIALATGAAAALLLAGCTAMTPEPKSSPSASATCDPSTATVTWEPKRDDLPREIGYQLRTISPEGSLSTDERLVEYESTLTSGDTLSAPFDRTDENWVEFFLDEFARTGQSTSTNLGDPQANFDSVKWEPEGPGNWVVGYRTSQIYVPFTLDCGGGTVGEGQLTTSENTDLMTTLVQCGYEPTDDVYGMELYEYCPSD